MGKVRQDIQNEKGSWKTRQSNLCFRVWKEKVMGKGISKGIEALLKSLGVIPEDVGALKNIPARWPRRWISRV